MIGALCALACSVALFISGDSVTMQGREIAKYVDDTAPAQCAEVAQYQSQGWTVLAGVPPSAAYDGYQRCIGALQAQEWYPYDCRYPAGAWGPMPAAQVYILQRNFAWPGCASPTAHQQARLLRQALRHHPLAVFWY